MRMPPDALGPGVDFERVYETDVSHEARGPADEEARVTRKSAYARWVRRSGIYVHGDVRPSPCQSG